MAVRTSSSSRANPAAALALLLGLLAIVAVPAGIAASQYLPSVPLLHGLYAGVPAALALGLLSVLLARRARRRLARTLGRCRGRYAARTGRGLALVGLYVGCAGAISIGVYTGLQMYS